VALNRMVDVATAMPLVWGDESALGSVLQGGALDMVIASDVVYDPHQHAALIQTLTAAASHPDADYSIPRAILALPDRGDGSIIAFIKRSQKDGWQWHWQSHEEKRWSIHLLVGILSPVRQAHVSEISQVVSQS
jgi:hypothetical protein